MLQFSYFDGLLSSYDVIKSITLKKNLNIFLESDWRGDLAIVIGGRAGVAIWLMRLRKSSGGKTIDDLEKFSGKVTNW